MSDENSLIAVIVNVFLWIEECEIFYNEIVVLVSIHVTECAISIIVTFQHLQKFYTYIF